MANQKKTLFQVTTILKQNLTEHTRQEVLEDSRELSQPIFDGFITLFDGFITLLSQGFVWRPIHFFEIVFDAWKKKHKKHNGKKKIRKKIIIHILKVLGGEGTFF